MVRMVAGGERATDRGLSDIDRLGDEIAEVAGYCSARTTRSCTRAASPWGAARTARSPFHRPDGREIAGVPPSTRVLEEPFATIEVWNHGAGIAITPETTLSRWDGEPMDDQAAIESLLVSRHCRDRAGITVGGSRPRP